MIIRQALLLIAVFISLAFSAEEGLRSSGIPTYTIETAHFRINYHEGLLTSARECAEILENLYDTYRKTFNLYLPYKVEILVINNDEGDGFADYVHGIILVTVNGLDFINLRGSHDYLRDVLAHEYGHIISINTGLKLPTWLALAQFGFFTHPNEPRRVDVLQALPNEVLPLWITEGMAQYLSSQHGRDYWDSHRDMILRTMVLSGKLAPWDKMPFMAADKLDELEKNFYLQGFSLVKYIADTYGFDKVVAMLRETGKLQRLNFDRSIKAVLDISGNELYENWKRSLELHYKQQAETLGTQIYGKRITKDGYNNYWPRLSHDEKKVYFVSNGKEDFAYFKGLFSYTFIDTVKEDKRVKEEMGIKGFYDIYGPANLIAFSSAKSLKSNVSRRKGGGRTRDLFIDSLPPDKDKLVLFEKKSERQATKKKSIFQAAFSPAGNRFACSQHSMEKYYLCIMDTSGKNLRRVYPDSTKKDLAIQTIYSIDWSPDGRHIAIGFLDTLDRKIGIYDTATREFSLLCDTKFDERDPRFTRDGKAVYFSSDRTGIFNIFRFTFETNSLERVTNVSGGAFAPEISQNGKKLIYTGYDKDGFQIFALDTIKTLSDSTIDSALVLRQSKQPAPSRKTAMSEVRPYSYMPRKFLLVPTFFSEQTVTDNNDPFKGKGVFKAGAVFNIMDPMAWTEQGNEIGGYFLVDPSRFLNFILPDSNGFVNYDIGLFGSTDMFPFNLSGSYSGRAITGQDLIWVDGIDTSWFMTYLLFPQNVDIIVSKNLGKSLNTPIVPHFLASYNLYDVSVVVMGPLGPYPAEHYAPLRGFRLGSYFTFSSEAKDVKQTISPRGLYAKLKYEYWNQLYQNEEIMWDYSKQGLAVYYDTYRYNQITGQIKSGMALPYSKNHHLYFEAGGTTLALTEANKKYLRKRHVTDELPSFQQPVEWLPGYTYYFRDTLHHLAKNDTINRDSVRLVRDTVLITGNALAQVKVSYRFALWPRTIGKKIGFFYFDQLFGAVNFNAGAGWHNPSEILEFKYNDWLKSFGAEIRLQAITFNSFPFCMSARWDYGMDKPAPIGGHRFTLGISMSFDNWEYIEEPDYFSGMGRRAR